MADLTSVVKVNVTALMQKIEQNILCSESQTELPVKVVIKSSPFYVETQFEMIRFRGSVLKLLTFRICWALSRQFRHF